MPYTRRDSCVIQPPSVHNVSSFGNICTKSSRFDRPLVHTLPLHDRPVNDPYILYVALQSTGILTVAFDPSRPARQSLSILDTNTEAGYQPGWLSAHKDKIYSVSRSKYPDNSSVDGGVFAFQKHVARGWHQQTDRGDYSLQQFSNMSSGGTAAVYCDVSPEGQTMAVANIDGSIVTVYPISERGLIGPASYTFKYNLTQPGPGTNGSQLQSNPHEAIFDPSGQYMFVPDRGADRLYTYRVASPISVEQVHNTTLPPGTGPRHITFAVHNATRTFMYLVSELDNTVRVFALDGLSNLVSTTATAPKTKLSMTLIQTISTVGLGSNRTEPNDHRLAAEVALSADGKFAYVSNRETTSLKSDTLAIFSVHPQAPEQHLVYLGQNATYGKTPRHFSLSPDTNTKYAAVGNKVTQNLVVLERDPKTGFVGKLVGNLSLGELDVTQNLGPTAVIWG